MAALSPAALVKAKSSSSAGSLDSLRGAAASGARQAPPSPTSSSSRLFTHDEPPQFPMDTETASSPAESMSRDVVKDSRRRDDDEFAELGVEELINKLPDVLFPFDGEAIQYQVKVIGIHPEQLHLSSLHMIENVSYFQ